MTIRKMITQREYPRLALFDAQIVDGRLRVVVPDSSTIIEVPLEAGGWSDQRVNVKSVGSRVRRSSLPRRGSMKLSGSAIGKELPAAFH